MNGLSIALGEKIKIISRDWKAKKSLKRHFGEKIDKLNKLALFFLKMQNRM